MKIAILSDIHGNLPALQAVVADIERWQPDLVVVNGDIVNIGPCSPSCVHLVMHQQASYGWQVLRGNHEDYVVAWASPNNPLSGPEYELTRLSHWTYQKLDGAVDVLTSLPDRFSWQAADESSLLVLHASIWGSRDGIYPWTTDKELRQETAPHPSVFVTAHTHIPFIRRLGGTLVVNVGSVGLPGDGDWRAGYGRLIWTNKHGWQAKIRRITYDREQTEHDYISSGLLDEAGPVALLSLVELRSARDAKFRWSNIYGERVLAGEISVDVAVREFLAQPEFKGYLERI